MPVNFSNSNAKNTDGGDNNFEGCPAIMSDGRFITNYKPNCEMNRTIELEKFFSILPAFRGSFQNINYNYNSIVNNSISKPYISNEENLLSIKQIRAMLSEYKLL